MGGLFASCRPRAHSPHPPTRRAQENITGVRKALDAIVPFYETHNAVKDIIAQGPTQNVRDVRRRLGSPVRTHRPFSPPQLDEYLHALSRLDSAVDYFVNNSKSNPELRRLQALNDEATVLLEAQFASVRCRPP
jgi:hypothetical protein